MDYIDLILMGVWISALATLLEHLYLLYSIKKCMQICFLHVYHLLYHLLVVHLFQLKNANNVTKISIISPTQWFISFDLYRRKRWKLFNMNYICILTFIIIILAFVSYEIYSKK